jgi:hypothetical protein
MDEPAYGRAAPADLEEGLETQVERRARETPALAPIDRGHQVAGVVARAGRDHAVEATEEARLVGRADE